MVSFLICVFQRNVKTAHVCVSNQTPKKTGNAYVFSILRGRVVGNAYVFFLCFLVFPKTTKFFAFFEARQRCAVEFL